ncbi:MAG: HAMP domain-containing protein [Chloroflexi bacterium]|nr:MAG: HAMP domain-containing protein [Chloroflexota bacterium]
MHWKSLRFRIAAVIVALTLVLGLGGTLRARSDLTRIAHEELEKRGVTIARDLAVQHADQILVNDIYTLYTLVNDFLLNNPDLRYIFILDAQGRVLVTTFPDGLPAGLRQANVPSPGGGYQVRRLRTTEGVIYDIAMPVAEGRAGVVRVGLLEAQVWAQVNRQTLGLLALTGIVTLLGAAAGFALGTFLTRPLSELVGITQAVARGDLRQKAAVKGSEEVEQLALAFNRMTEALATSRDELLRRNEELSALNAIAVAVGQSLEMDTVLGAALAKVLELMKLHAGWIFLLEDGDGRLTLAARQGVNADLFLPRLEGSSEPCVCQRILQSGQARLVESVEDCPRLKQLANNGGLGTCHVSVPLRSGDRVLGLMNLVCNGEGCPSNEQNLRLLTAIGHQIGVAVENARLYRELQHKEALRGELVKKLISAQEEERRRIARELHDQYAQALTALSMSIEATERAFPENQAPLKSQLESIKTLTARTLDQTYDLIFDLRPTILDDLGLVPAVRWYAESRLEPLGVSVHLETEGLQERLSPELETACYRVIQEALLNIAKHARARHVSIRLSLAQGRLQARVEDDGQGFDLEAVRRSTASGRGMGLLGMQERVELLGGILRIDSVPGHGTRVWIEVPIGHQVDKESYQHEQADSRPHRG